MSVPEPNYYVLIAPGVDATVADPAWVDVSADLRSVTINRGTQKEFDRNSPGEATFVLDNYLGVYDNENSGSPYAGELVPNMRVRVVAEWDGELHPRFDGYLDDVQLDYPDPTLAWATFQATDGFKILEKSRLPESVYTAEVTADDPLIWWRFNEGVSGEHVALNSGTGGSAYNGEYRGPPKLGEAGLIDRDPGAAIGVIDSEANAGTGDMGAFLAQSTFDLTSFESWAIEMWVRPESQSTVGDFAFVYETVLGARVQLFYADASGGRFRGIVQPSGGSVTVTSATGLAPHGRYHLVLKHGPNRAVSLYVNNVLVAGAATTGDFAVGDSCVGFQPNNPTLNWVGSIDEFAVYTSALAVDPLPDARVAAHYSAGTTPWTGDSPAERAGRVCDLVGWPELLRDFDAGTVTLQGADLDMSALDHLHKIAESEFSNTLFVAKDGTLTLRDRYSLVNRAPLVEFGDEDGEVHYVGIRFDGSDELIRNPVTVSRSGGVAQTASDAANIVRYYPSQFTLDGLLHDSDDLSLAAAQFFVSEYKDPKRRITGLTFGPFDDEHLFDWFPALLEAELGGVYQVTFRPPNADPLIQLSVLEGTTETWDAEEGTGRFEWRLSPAYTGAMWQLGVHGYSELGDTTRLYF